MYPWSEHVKSVAESPYLTQANPGAATIQKPPSIHLAHSSKQSAPLQPALPKSLSSHHPSRKSLSSHPPPSKSLSSHPPIQTKWNDPYDGNQAEDPHAAHDGDPYAEFSGEGGGRVQMGYWNAPQFDNLHPSRASNMQLDSAKFQQFPGHQPHNESDPGAAAGNESFWEQGNLETQAESTQPTEDQFQVLSEYHDLPEDVSVPAGPYEFNFTQNYLQKDRQSRFTMTKRERYLTHSRKCNHEKEEGDGGLPKDFDPLDEESMKKLVETRPAGWKQTTDERHYREQLRDIKWSTVRADAKHNRRSVDDQYERDAACHQRQRTVPPELPPFRSNPPPTHPPGPARYPRPTHPPRHTPHPPQKNRAIEKFSVSSVLKPPDPPKSKRKAVRRKKKRRNSEPSAPAESTYHTNTRHPLNMMGDATTAPLFETETVVPGNNSGRRQPMDMSGNATTASLFETGTAVAPGNNSGRRQPMNMMSSGTSQSVLPGAVPATIASNTLQKRQPIGIMEDQVSFPSTVTIAAQTAKKKRGISIQLEPPKQPKRLSSARRPMNMMTNQISDPNINRIPQDIDGTALSDDDGMDLSSDEDVRPQKIVRPSSPDLHTLAKSQEFSSFYKIEVVSAEHAEQAYPRRKYGDTKQNIFQLVESPFAGTPFQDVIHYAPLPQCTDALCTPIKGHDERTGKFKEKLCVGQRYTVWLDESDSNFLCLRKLQREKPTPEIPITYRGFHPGQGIVRVNIAEVFYPEDSPMSDPGVYGCLERALPNTPPPDVWVTAVFPYTTNIMIASMQAVDVKDEARRANYFAKLVLFPYTIDPIYHEPSFPIPTQDLKTRFEISEFFIANSVKMLDIIELPRIDGVELLTLAPSEHKKALSWVNDIRSRNLMRS